MKQYKTIVASTTTKFDDLIENAGVHTWEMITETFKVNLNADGQITSYVCMLKRISY